MPIINGLLISDSLIDHVKACVNNGHKVIAVKDIKNTLNITLAQAAGIFNGMKIPNTTPIKGAINSIVIIEEHLPEDAFLYG